MAYEFTDLDFATSPLTGLNWNHWAGLGQYLLEGCFKRLPDAQSMLVFPRHENEVSYPRPDDPQWRLNSATFESVARTLLVAAPLLTHQPDLSIESLRIADWYRWAIGQLADSRSRYFVGRSADIVSQSGDRPYQMTCECASLVVGLQTAPSVLWDPLPEDTQTNLLNLLHDWGHHRTHPHNWRLFNILILTFLIKHGVSVDRELYENHLCAIDSFYAGDGWYRDGTLFDYYSVWAFQFYLSIWINWIGKEQYPELAQRFADRINTLLETYDRLFSRRGHQFMWGRSNIYRFAASSVFGSAFLLDKTLIDPGQARASLSKNLLQFVTHPEFLQNGVPTLGFYGPFKPLIQPYSCAASPFWFGNAYHAVALGPTHPFWTTSEIEGSWKSISSEQHVDTLLPGPGIMVTQHGPSGASEMRTGKVMTDVKGNLLPHYSRLSFNTDFPWQADTANGLASSHYNLRAQGNAYSPNLILFGPLKDNVLYRRIVFDFKGALSRQPTIDLADFSIPGGLLRVDRLRFPEAHDELILTHYPLPIQGQDLILNRRQPAKGIHAVTASSGNRRLALVSVLGWDDIRAQRESGLHPQTNESCLLCAHSKGQQAYHGMPFRVTLLLHKIDGSDWSDHELWPFAQTQLCIRQNLQVGNLELTANGLHCSVDFYESEGTLIL